MPRGYKRSRAAILWITGAWVVLAWFGTEGHAQEARSTEDGVFTERQASRGERIFARYCGGCHQTDQFTQNGLLGRHEGETLHQVYETLRATMPQDSPGKLKPREYAVVLAYIFSLNGLPAGEEPLEMDEENLKGIVVTGLKTPESQ